MTNLKTTDDLAIPLGSLILVTGASGYIGSNCVQEALDAGFRVRGTARSQEKCDKTKATFNHHSNYETAVVEDMTKEGAFDEAVKGVDAILHVASVVNFSPDPHVVIHPTVRTAVSVMEAALKEPKVKRFVYTSSSTAAGYPKPNTKYHFGKDTWNTEAEQYVDMQPPYKDELAFQVYGASKTKAEQAVWQFVRDKKPQFVVNSILPNANLGRILDQRGATGDIVPLCYHGKPLDMFDPQYMIDVVDDARIHVAAAIDKTIANERIYAFDSPFNNGEILKVLKELRPNKQFVDPKPDEGEDISTVDNKLGAELLKKWWGQDGYAGLKKAVEANLVKDSL